MKDGDKGKKIALFEHGEMGSREILNKMYEAMKEELKPSDRVIFVGYSDETDTKIILNDMTVEEYRKFEAYAEAGRRVERDNNRKYCKICERMVFDDHSLCRECRKYHKELTGVE